MGVTGKKAHPRLLEILGDIRARDDASHVVVADRVHQPPDPA
jgi:hypothetical protein